VAHFEGMGTASLREQTGLGVWHGRADQQRTRSRGPRPTSLARRERLWSSVNDRTAEPFFRFVNHWKSRLPSSPLTDEPIGQSADWLGKYLANERRMRCVVAVGTSMPSV